MGGGASCDDLTPFGWRWRRRTSESRGWPENDVKKSSGEEASGPPLGPRAADEAHSL